MREKRRSSHPGGARMRPPDPDDDAKIIAGTQGGMRVTGYDYPVRQVRRVNGSACVTLPMQVRNHLLLDKGDWLAFGSTPWPGLAAFMRVTGGQYRAIAGEGRAEFRKLARKVHAGNGALSVAIPRAVRKALSAEVGDVIHFGIRSVVPVVIISVVKGGGDSNGMRGVG